MRSQVSDPALAVSVGDDHTSAVRSDGQLALKTQLTERGMCQQSEPETSNESTFEPQFSRD